jgi:hypothetical protein
MMINFPNAVLYPGKHYSIDTQKHFAVLAELEPKKNVNPGKKKRLILQITKKTAELIQAQFSESRNTLSFSIDEDGLVWDWWSENGEPTFEHSNQTDVFRLFNP